MSIFCDGEIERSTVREVLHHVKNKKYRLAWILLKGFGFHRSNQQKLIDGKIKLNILKRM